MYNRMCFVAVHNFTNNFVVLSDFGWTKMIFFNIFETSSSIGKLNIKNATRGYLWNYLY